LKHLRVILGATGFFLLSLGTVFAVSSQEPSVNYLFRDSFYVPASLKLKYDIQEIAGFLLERDPKRGWNSQWSVVTGFQDPVLESRTLKNIRTASEAKTFLERNMRKIFFERVPIKELPLISKAGEPAPRFWVGQRAFPSLEEAQAEIAKAKSAIETGGGNFDRALELVTEFFPEETAPTQEEIQARYKMEEKIALEVLDWLQAGEKLYGPLTGVPQGEPILWQSFGDTSFRWTNLDRGGFNDQVGFWTNRMVFKGLRFLGEQTVDPYVEVTTALESQGANFTKHLDLVGGLEYRPLGRAAFLDNFNFDGIHVLRFARNYRWFIQYMERKNLTDEIAGSRDTDLWIGTDVFYEWGLDLTSGTREGRRRRWSEWIQDYVWGEYYGSYRYERTDFSTIDSFNSWILNSSAVFGLKWPSLDLPSNPINDELTIMPYVRLEHVTNNRRPKLSHQNRFFVSGGIRWMPFRSYQFANNEWLFKTKFFAEYVGIGGVHHPGPSKPADVPNRDWRVGASVSFKRY
jgi:hypothetical protein